MGFRLFIRVGTVEMVWSKHEGYFVENIFVCDSCPYIIYISINFSAKKRFIGWLSAKDVASRGRVVYIAGDF